MSGVNMRGRSAVEMALRPTGRNIRRETFIIVRPWRAVTLGENPAPDGSPSGPEMKNSPY